MAVVLFLVLRGGDDDPGDEQSAAPSATATATATPTAQPQVADEIDLTAPGGGKATGRMAVFLQGEQLLFALQGAEAPRQRREGLVRRLAHRPRVEGTPARVHGPGRRRRQARQIQGPGEKDLAAFPKLYATYANVVVSRESAEDAKRRRTSS